MVESSTLKASGIHILDRFAARPSRLAQISCNDLPPHLPGRDGRHPRGQRRDRGPLTGCGVDSVLVLGQWRTRPIERQYGDEFKYGIGAIPHQRLSEFRTNSAPNGPKNQNTH